MAAISSPRYRNEPLQEVPGSKLRLMCSYGGHIMPRHHDNSLSYIGGDTRIIAVDRNSSFKDLIGHLSRTLLHGRPFTLRYHLPNEDLDNLITVLSDEDLQNMIEEYDRLSSKPSRSRLRMFLFFSKPDTAVSMGTFLDANSDESWFVEALNNSGNLSRVVSDSAAAVDCLVNLHDLELESHDEQKTIADHDNKHDLLDVLEFPVEENISSDESSSLSYSISNLPPIRVHVDEDVDTFGVKQLDDAFAISSALLPPDDDVSADNQKPPLPLQILPPRAGGGGLGLPSPGSAASDNSSSITSAKPIVNYQQDQLVQQAAAHVDLPNNHIKTDNQVQNQQQPDQNHQFQTHQQQQQQFVYVHHPHPVGTTTTTTTTGGQVPISSYYSVYAAAPPTQQQYPVYVMPVGSTQQYSIANLQSNNIAADPNVVTSVRQIIPQSDVATTVYKAPLASNPSFIQIPTNQFQQQQYVNLPQSIAMPPSAAATTNYGNYEYGGRGPTQDQVYYTQHDQQQYQSMNHAALSDVSKQYNNIQQPNISTQPV